MVLDEILPGVCYQVERDSASWLRVIPPRFTLTRDPATGRNVVRAVSPAANADTVLPGSQWNSEARTGIRIQFASAADTPPVSLLIPPEGTNGQASAGGQSQPVNVRRTSCPP